MTAVNEHLTTFRTGKSFYVVTLLWVFLSGFTSYNYTL